jgi:hypothetical protein
MVGLKKLKQAEQIVKVLTKCPIMQAWGVKCKFRFLLS